MNNKEYIAMIRKQHWAEENTTSLNYTKAYEALLKGEKITRRGWTGKTMYLFLKDNEIQVVRQDKKISTGWIPSDEDEKAEDWAILFTDDIDYILAYRNSVELPTTPELRSLDESNREKLKKYIQENTELKNGLACPKCGNELYDSSPYEVLFAYPSQKKVICECGFQSYRFV